ncbi:hypothetical protein [Roseovarius sp. 2305UL8-3]|uniref:hypothetical protein n=1 Tax=Roseovarius conchicola TaxID=3121636 RepID=UPI0035283DB9
MLRFAPLLLALLIAIALPLRAQSSDEPATEAPMTLERLNEIIMVLDPEALREGTIWQLQIAEVPVLIVTDPAADRMRAVAPVREADGLTQEELTRMMQANFDSALDGRYAIAKGMLWSTFIHPLGPLEKDQFISGLGQVVNLTQSYGTLYSGGAMQYGGGDSQGLQRALIDELLKKGEEI